MEPLTALLFSLWIAGYFTRNVYEDAVFKARGEDPPSFRRQQQRWERQQDRRERGPGPARKFVGNAWADAVTAADEKRSRRAAKASAARRKKWEEEDQAEETAQEDQKTEREAHDRQNREWTGSDRSDRHGPGGDAAADDQDARTGSGEHSVACTICGNPVPDSQRRYVIPRDRTDYVIVCPGCAYAEAAEKYREQEAGPAGPPPASCADCGRTDEPVAPFMGRTRCRDCQLAALDTEPDPAPESGSDPAEPATAASPPPVDQGPFEDDDLPDPDDAEVIQFADWQRPAASTTSKEKNMSAEITGLRSAIEFVEGSAASAEAAVSQVELAIANLQTGGTSGPAVAALQAAMEGHQTTASHYRTAAATLTQQLQVAEAYEANKGAGSREFVTSE